MPITRTAGLTALLAAGALTLGACSSSSDTSTTATTAAPATSMKDSPTTTAKSTTGTMATKSDIVDTAVAAGQFTTLAKALTAAGLVDTLKGPGPFTVFAPTDDAFAKLPAGTLDDLLKPENKEKLTKILTYHVIKGEVMAKDVVTMDGKTVETVSGETLTVKVNGDKVSLVDGSGQTVAVVKTDIGASNGVIHVIDGVLLPKG